ncbi:ABC transporter ATP-binding protein/permease [Synechococcus sp. CB0101]|uniref:ABC transporter ATP-binding protein/permease n=1 Tax=Synechococcus sp. CB0101 TaxID=232348 RepID=UPI0002D9C406|nr:ABC transporter ATP-binding protein/permease [Synechococcus sp. CB0101]QCH15884.1 ABC transporter ATP-binding protein/permease [Synechococcus sp. CB0101]
MNPLQAFRSQLGKLRRLAQPYFLPVEDTSAWQFLLLIVALITVVVGSTLLLLSGVVAASGALIPELQARFLPGVPQQVNAIWASPAGPVVMVLFVAGLICFGALRSKLRQGRWLPWLLMGLITLLILVINGINVGISFIARNIENALVAYQVEQFWEIVAIYAFCLVLALPVRAILTYLNKWIGLLWREWLSGRLLSRYLSGRAYYVLNPNDEMAEEIDNPDQRISDDAKEFTRTSVEVLVEVAYALLTFSSFILVLWSISSSLAVYLLLYSVLGTAIVVYASRKLVALNYGQLRLEADFRYGLVHIRDNAESIAFYRGEQQEGREASRRLKGVISNYNKLIVWEALIGVIQRSYDYFSRFLPWLIIAPIYFAKDVDFGVFGQAGIAFSQVLSSVSYIVNNIDRLAAFSASISRLEGFQGKVDAISRSEAQRDLLADEASAASRSLVVRHVDLVPPQSDRRLIHDLSLEVGTNQRVLVVGPSGCGKTSFLRLVSGLWPPAAGEVERPPVSELLFIPQKPYMLLGSLREQLCYPQDPQRFSDEHLRSVLEEVRLGALVQRYPDFDIKQDWPRLLSLGEQQRLAFARLLLNSPRFVVLDEATSALDVSTEQHLYALLTQREMAFVSVGHRPTLKAFHNLVLELDGLGGWKLMPATSYTFNSGV